MKVNKSFWIELLKGVLAAVLGAVGGYSVSSCTIESGNKTYPAHVSSSGAVVRDPVSSSVNLDDVYKPAIRDPYDVY